VHWFTRVKAIVSLRTSNQRVISSQCWWKYRRLFSRWDHKWDSRLALGVMRLLYSRFNKDIGITRQIFWKGEELPKTYENLEKLGFTPFCKMLIISTHAKYFSINRYRTKYNGWCYIQRSIDWTTFSTNKDIRLMRLVFISRMTQFLEHFDSVKEKTAFLVSFFR